MDVAVNRPEVDIAALTAAQMAKWKPWIPPCERARGLEAEEVYTLEQITLMRELTTCAVAAAIQSNNQRRSNSMSDADRQEGARAGKTAALQEDRRRDNIVEDHHKIDLNERVNGKNKKKTALVKEWVSISEHLDEADFEVILSEARKRARVGLFLKTMKESNQKPMKYADSPRSLKLIDFIKREWVDKGFNPADVDRKMLAAYDDKLVRAIENHEYSTGGALPANLQFPKVGNRRSHREMTAH